MTTHSPARRRAALALGTTAAVALLVLGAPLAASAHVAVSPDTATPGSDVAITFRVPNESATARTVRVEIDLPTATPFAGAEYDPVAGWSARVTTATLPTPLSSDGVQVTEAPRAIVFTAAAGGGIADGQFQEFSLALDLVPTTGRVLLPVTQTYSDGTVVRWDQPTPASGAEPDHPAPTLYITDAPPSGDHAATAGDGGPTIAAHGEAAAGAGVSDPTAVILASAGLAIAVVALVVALFAYLRPRGRASGPSSRPQASGSSSSSSGSGSPSDASM
ncbi:YcnI family protein [Galbitalea soli]|uniref:YcnI family protein n=1 Tax=Galbitalea soli TaxID=1268042 RepID=A0A7C9PPA9_9MICO|nr:YcnI family protein [Galbitalea soli]NEM92254.1 YcnI family protein [Galbitalea soli]NYJ31790.1 uncharacterized protein YcnI [Galbitalea soli]